MDDFKGKSGSGLENIFDLFTVYGIQMKLDNYQSFDISIWYEMDNSIVRNS